MQLSKVKKIKARHDTVLHCVTLKTYTYIHVDICMIVKVEASMISLDLMPQKVTIRP
jgi:hypothetical protein